jgi:hypothetical protein
VIPSFPPLPTTLSFKASAVFVASLAAAVAGVAAAVMIALPSPATVQQEVGEVERDSFSSKMIFRDVLLSRGGRTGGVKVRPRIWPWRLRVTSRKMTGRKKQLLRI